MQLVVLAAVGGSVVSEAYVQKLLRESRVCRIMVFIYKLTTFNIAYSCGIP